ncbi:Cytochrome P450 monooxygenase [Lachnellula occidentalis]|uniref:Cytochrome P450 monooxygenase n=1 Tax=Lachnellula occidentalis TaxID=215460 RepID=A0A8H8U8P8_9HELO|nr:Cytochrome P450 monooxygenase [Lachnellula occidentalis]
MDFLHSRDFKLDDVGLNVVPKWSYFLYFVVVLLTTKALASPLWRYVQELKKGCGSVARLPQLDPFLGLDVILKMTASLKKHTYLRWLNGLHAEGKSKTITFHFLGTKYIHTMESENMKTIFGSSIWKDFQVSPLRHTNHATEPFAKQGAAITDGQEWEDSRLLIKPYFVREISANTERLEKHTENLLSHIPKDGSTFDMQVLLQRWSHQFLDTSTESLFGESVGSLQDPQRAEIAWAMTVVLRGLRLRFLMVRWLWLFRQKTWFDAVNFVHAYVDGHIDKAYAQLAEKKQAAAVNSSSGNGSTMVIEEQPERTDLIWSMVKTLGQDRERIRSEMVIIFTPNNDTNSIFIGNIFWNLARRPDVYAKVREEVLAHGPGAQLTCERLRSMKYLDAVLNETHRLFPTNITQTRTSMKDTTLPRGGGRDGKLPIYIKKGDVVRVNKNGMFRDKDFWGQDADEWKPERWAKLSPSWHFMPFSGGARRCPAQPQVTTEASYCIAKFAQRFKAIENRDPNPYMPIIRITPIHMHGVKIGLIPA